MWGFYWRWLKTAIWHGFGPADLWSGLAGALVGIIDHYWPDLQLLTHYGWQIPIWAFASVVLVRLIAAPYWMWLDDQKISPSKVDIERRKSLTSLRSDGVKLRNKGARLGADLPKWLDEVDQWRVDAIAAINTIEEADADWFATLDAVPAPRVPALPIKGGEGQHLKAFREHDYRLVRLDQP